jgi:hypothetical protein
VVLGVLAVYIPAEKKHRAAGWPRNELPVTVFSGEKRKKEKKKRKSDDNV